MEQKKLDLNSIIGFVLIFGILIWIMYQNSPDPSEIKKEKAGKVDTKEVKKQSRQTALTGADTIVSDSLALEKLRGKLGAFAYSGTLASAKGGSTVLENELIRIEFSNKGGYISEATLKQFDRLKKGSGEKVKLISGNNAQFGLKFKTSDNRLLDTRQLYFEPIVTKMGDNQVLTMRLKASEGQYLEYRYVLKAGEYMLDFDITSKGLSQVLDQTTKPTLEWDVKTYRNEKSISYENRYAEVVYEYDGGKDDYLAQGENQETEEEAVTYIAYKQHFFTSILLTETPFESAKMFSNDLVKDEEKDTIFTKEFRASAPLALRSGELNYRMNWYYGPADYRLLTEYDRNLDEIIPLGWGIFGWINKFIFIPIFGLLVQYIPYGIAIILFTLIIKLAMSPITYRSFLSQAKMRVLRPEITELNEKFKKDPMKRQQETMKLYGKAGVNPLAGCVPALIQLPFLYASFQFFPAAIELRQKSFLWAEDLSSYDAILELPFTIPFYGAHVSLFPILAAIAIFFYMKMTTGDQAMSTPPQEGMPDMQKVMKIMIWISPLMMLIFFNNYGSGLSLYNFISNLATIGLMVIIKKYVVDEEKIHAQIQENKLKPKKQSKFQQRMQELMEQAEAEKAKKLRK